MAEGTLRICEFNGKLEDCHNAGVMPFELKKKRILCIFDEICIYKQILPADCVSPRWHCSKQMLLCEVQNL
jgi:hypothetical protein